MIELLAPAGNLEKLKIAILYGADAVYIGGKKFSLRARASNFDIDDIRAGCAFAKEHQAKIYVTMNIVPHDEDFLGIEEYLLTPGSLEPLTTYYWRIGSNNANSCVIFSSIFSFTTSF